MASAPRSNQTVCCDLSSATELSRENIGSNQDIMPLRSTVTTVSATPLGDGAWRAPARCSPRGCRAACRSGQVLVCFRADGDPAGRMVAATLECELIACPRQRTPSEARMAVFTFVEGFCNPHAVILPSAISAPLTTKGGCRRPPLPGRPTFHLSTKGGSFNIGLVPPLDSAMLVPRALTTTLFCPMPPTGRGVKSEQWLAGAERLPAPSRAW